MQFLDLTSSSKTFVREIEIFNCSLNVHQAYIGDVGCVVWDAALVLVKYLEKSRNKDLNNKKVLELGAGTGIVGLCCSLAGYAINMTTCNSCNSVISYQSYSWLASVIINKLWQITFIFRKWGQGVV